MSQHAEDVVRTSDNEHGSPALALTDVSKAYGNSTVLRGLTLKLDRGCCVGIVGENGAGKSTALRIMAGVVPQSAGTIEIEGEPTRFSSPRNARAKGIILIPQELAYTPDQDVATNVFLGHWPHRRGVVRSRMMRSSAEGILETLGVPIDVRRMMRALSLAERQLVEIAKALAFEARIILLDEPTAALNSSESRRLLAVLQDLKARGIALVYVSHHLQELQVIADDVLVLRNGETIDLLPASDSTPERLVPLMLGPDYLLRKAKTSPVDADPPRLLADCGGSADRSGIEVSHWASAEIPCLEDVSFTVGPGEILGVYGLIGSGIETLADGLGGLHPRGLQGQITIGDQTSGVFRTPSAAKRSGVLYVPADRKAQGLMLRLPLRLNLNLDAGRVIARCGFIARRRDRARAAGLIAKYRIRSSSMEQLVGELSGGNQQKVLLANRLGFPSSVLVLHEPTRGVDVGAREEIHEFIRDTARQGTAVILVSTDTEEISWVSDRVIVLRDGRIALDATGTRQSEERIFAAATEGAQ